MSYIAITRASNGLQARVRRRWKYLPASEKTLAIVSECGYEAAPGFFFCGMLRHEGEDVALYYETSTQEWCGVLDDNDYLITGEYEKDFYGAIQEAFLAITGMNDDDIAQFLGVKPSTVKTWYSEKARTIPWKHIKAIVDAFLHNDDNACKLPKKR